MHINSSMTSVSWIPSEAIPGALKIPMILGISHYDAPPPDTLDDLAALHAAGRFRFANRLEAWIEADDDGRIVDAGHDGSGLISSTIVTLGGRSRAIPPVPFPDIQREPEVGDGWVRFLQTTGGTKPTIRRVEQGATLTEEGEAGDEIYLVLDGMLTVEVGGRMVAEIGPGAVVGERAVLEGGARTSTLRATTPCRVAVADADQIDRDALIELSEGHRRENASTDGAGPD